MNITIIITASIICATVITCFRMSARYDCKVAELTEQREALRNEIIHLEHLAHDLDVQKDSQNKYVVKIRDYIKELEEFMYSY